MTSTPEDRAQAQDVERALSLSETETQTLPIEAKRTPSSAQPESILLRICKNFSTVW
jgi:hypothetical protein